MVLADERTRGCAHTSTSAAPQLTSIIADYTTLLELLPAHSPQVTETRRKLHALKPRIEAAQKRETDEMLGKLKDLGNTFLGK